MNAGTKLSAGIGSSLSSFSFKNESEHFLSQLAWNSESGTMMSDWIFKANKLSNPSPRVHTNMFTAVSETRLFTMKMVENFPSTGHWTSGQAVNCQCHLLFFMMI